MRADLQFEFLIDRENNTMTIRKEFAAGRSLVWDCHTKSELLDQWFAPRPLQTRTKTMDFSEGGHWHYAMIDPDGSEYWGRLDYLTIRRREWYTALDGFSDASGAIAEGMPRSNWKVTFTDAGARTLVENRVSYDSAEQLDQVIAMGMKDGMTSAIERLDELLAELTE